MEEKKVSRRAAIKAMGALDNHQFHPLAVFASRQCSGRGAVTACNY